MDPGSIVGAVWTIDRTTPPVDLDARELLVTLSASGPSYVSDDASFAVWSATMGEGQRGDPVRLTFKRYHLFEKDSGLRLRSHCSP